MIQLPTDAIFIWVGGALDGYTRLLARYVPATLPERHHYVHWYQHRRLRQLMHRYPAAQLVLIGHSYGATTAAQLVAQGHQVALLITIDPVGRRPIAMAQVAKYCQHWLNFRAADTRNNFANWVARLGGWWQQKPQAHAHQHIDIQADHALIVSEVMPLFTQFKQAR